MMNDKRESLSHLIKSLDDFLGDQSLSIDSAKPDGEQLKIQPIEEEWPELYEAVQDVERWYPRGMLPRQVRSHWIKLLDVSRTPYQEPILIAQGYMEGEAILEWATAELQGSVEVSRSDTHSCPEDGPLRNSPGIIYYGGEQFRLSKHRWNLLCLLWDRNGGVTFLKLAKKLWDIDTQSSTIRSSVSRLGSDINAYGIPWSFSTLKERVYLDKHP